MADKITDNKKATMQNKKSAEVVVARRLRPIYDSLDAGQHKKAIVEADKVLKKHPEIHTAKALKALSLIRMERSTEAVPLLKTVEKDLAQEEEFDENTVQALCHCYKELNEPERIVTLYTSLGRRHPDTEKLKRELFFGHVRIRDFRQQQQVAMQLYKETNNPQYLCWAVMSILMQGQGGANQKLGQTMFFPLAEKMLEKLPTAELYHTSGGFDLHLLVLESRAKYQEAIDLIKTNPKLTVNTHSDEELKHRLDSLYMQTDNRVALTARALHNLGNDPNELSNWKLHAKSLLKMFEHATPDECDKYIFEHSNTWLRIMESANTGDFPDKSKKLSLATVRAPLIGRLLLLQQFYEGGMLDEDRLTKTALGTPLAALKALVETDYIQPFTYMDLKKFLSMLNSESAQQLLDHIGAYGSSDEEQQESETKSGSAPSHDFQYNNNKILWEQLHHHFHPPRQLTDEQLHGAVQRIAQYLMPDCENGNENGNNCGEKQPVELAKNSNENGNNCGENKSELAKHLNGVQLTSMVQLLAQYCWEWYTRRDHLDILLQLIAFLELVNAQRPDCTASIPITLCRLYGIFGDIGRITALEKQIQMKFIQRDSLAFLHFFVPQQFGLFKTANIYYTSLGAMYDMNEREVNECLVQAYRSNSFYQIPKIVEFALLSLNSLFSIGADVLNRCVSGCFVVGPELAAATLQGDGNQQIDWSAVEDNRDFSVLPPICPSESIAKIREFSFKEMLNYFKLRHTLTNAIGHIGSAQLAGKVTAFNETLAECRREFVDSAGLEKLLESYVNLRLHQLVAPANKLFCLPSAVLGMALKLMPANDGKPPMTAGEQNKICDLNEFSACLEDLHKFYAHHNLAELDGNIAALQSIAIVLEMLALSLVGCKLLANGMKDGTATQAQQQNGILVGKNGGEKRAEKQQKSSPPVAEPLAEHINLIGQSLERIHTFLSANFNNDGNGKSAPVPISEEQMKAWAIGETNRKMEEFERAEQRLFPKSFYDKLRPQFSRVLASIRMGHSAAAEEMQAALSHLLLNHCALNMQSVKIQK